LNILIVDDEKILWEDMHDALERVTGGGNTYNYAYDYYSAMELVNKHPYDVAFLDVQMPGKNGIALAESIKKIRPSVNIVMVTAYDNYALDALKLYVSGYLLKPVMDKDVANALEHLRNPVSGSEKLLEIQCFGNFEVFADNKPLPFKRKKEKELLAYLVCLKGASASRAEICVNIFDDEDDEEKCNAYFKTIYSALKADLYRFGFENVLIHANNAYSIDVRRIKCDYYDYLKGVAESDRTFRGKFLEQYVWSERYIYDLERY